MHQACRNLGEEVKQGVRANRDDGGYSEAEDQNGQQQNTAAQPGQADQSAYQESNDDFGRNEIHRVLRAPPHCDPQHQAGVPLAPIYPWRSRCKMISWADSSGDRSAVLMTTSAF